MTINTLERYLIEVAQYSRDWETNYIDPYMAAYDRAHIAYTNTLGNQAAIDIWQAQAATIALSIGFGAGVNIFFAQTTLSAVVSDRVASFISSRNISAAARALNYATTNPTASFVLGGGWAGITTLSQIGIQNRMLALTSSLPNASNALQTPRSVDRSMRQHFRRMASAAHDTAREVAYSGVYNEQARRDLLDSLLASEFSNPPQTTVSGAGRNGPLEKALELSMYLVAVLNSDFYCGSSTGVQFYRRPINESASSRQYPQVSPSVRGSVVYRVEFEQLGSNICDRIDELYREKWGRPFFQSRLLETKLGKDEVQRAERALREMHRRYNLLTLHRTGT